MTDIAAPELNKAAGVLFIAGDRVLLLQRAFDGDHDFPGSWAFPGGRIEDGETPAQAAAREVFEETGYEIAPEALIEHARRVADGTEFTCFVANVDAPFNPTLNEEHAGFLWASPLDLPANIHPGVPIMLARIDMDELDLARAIRDGQLASPQRYLNVWLYDLRITGTGAAYRDKLDEYCWRDPAMYLNPDFLERCQGLAIVWLHPPKSMLNTEEYRDRNVGAIMLPYIKGDEVWGVAKIQDEDAALLMAPPRQMSTSPGVILAGSTPPVFETLADGTKILIENSPKLLDHLAICDAGVWDKLDPPCGVNTSGDHAVADERKDAEGDKTEEKKDAAVEGAMDKKSDAKKDDAEGGGSEAMIDAICEKMASMFDAKMDAKLDAMCSKMDARMDAMEGKSDKKDSSEGDKDEKKEDAKKDASEDETKADKKDGKKDSADEEARKKADSAHGRLDAHEAETKRRLDEVHAKIADRPDADLKDLTDAQARADSVMHLFGEQAPRFLAGESTAAYRRRLATPLKKHSADWKDVDLAKLDASSFGIAERQILADAAREGKNPARFVEGLQPIVSQDGRMTTYHGNPKAWMDTFGAGARQHVTSIMNPSTGVH